MKHCISCDQFKPESAFPSVGAVTCSFCTPTAMDFIDSETQSRVKPELDFRNDKRKHVHHTIGPDSTHSLGIKPHPHGNSIAKSLLNIAGYKSHVGPMAPPVNVNSETVNLPDDRTLIDKVHEATFTDGAGLNVFADKYALRMLLRKAHCFTLDQATSAMVADFSVAVAKDLEGTRRLAIPPFPVTWIDLDNVARLNRVKALGIKLTPSAAGEVAGPPVERVGWLIHPCSDMGGFYASYFCQIDEGIATAPLSYWWHTAAANPLDYDSKDPKQDRFIQGLTFGVTDVNVSPLDAYPSPTPMHQPLKKINASTSTELMSELAGELRHIWGLLVALGAGQMGLEAKTSPQAMPLRTPPVMKNGKPLLPLEHKVLHLHLAKRATPDRVVTKAILHHKNREHEVRAHVRTLRDSEGNVRKHVPVKSHKRGDERLGKIEKTYRVER
jgi:hypothetical protein